MDLSSRLTGEFGDALESQESQAFPFRLVAPRDEATAVALVAWCGRERVAFETLGNGSQSFHGARLQRCDLVIGTQHLNAVIDHDEGNATVEAGAGLSMSELNRLVGEKRQFVPFGVEKGTLGGVVATNASSAERLKWGTPRDGVTGLSAALSDGRVVKAGSKVVKNVSGYDLSKLFVGSLGTLGLITRVTIRLRPCDEATRIHYTQHASLEAAGAAAWAILDGPFEPTGVRVVFNGAWILTARLDGSEKSVASQWERLPEPDEGGAEFSDVGALSVCANLPLRRAASWLARARELGADACEWQTGSGVARAVWRDGDEAALRGHVQTMREAAVGLGGFLRVEHAPESLQTPDIVWGEPRDATELELMRRLKARFDPANVCAPGRMIGGL